MKIKKINSFFKIFGKLPSLFNKSKLQDEYKEVIENIVKNNEFDDYFENLINANDYISARKFLDEGYKPNKNNELLLNNLAVAAFYREVPISFKKKEFIVNNQKMKEIANLLNRCENYINILDYFIGKKTVLDNPTKNMYIATEKVEKNWVKLFRGTFYVKKNSTIVKLLNEKNKDMLTKYEQDIQSETSVLPKGILNLDIIYVYHFLMNKYNVNQNFHISCNNVREFFDKFEHYKTKNKENLLGRRKISGSYADSIDASKINSFEEIDSLNYADSIDVSLNMILFKNFHDFVKENSIEYQNFVKNVISLTFVKDFRFHTILGIFDTDNFASKLGIEHWKEIENNTYNNLTFDNKIKELLKEIYDKKKNDEFVDVVEKFKKVKESSKLENLINTDEATAIEYLVDSLGLKSSKTAENLGKIQEILSDLKNKKINTEVKNFISNINKEIIDALISYEDLKKVDLNLDIDQKLSNVTLDIFNQLKTTYINVLKEQLKELEVEVPLNKKRLVNR